METIVEPLEMDAAKLWEMSSTKPDDMIEHMLRRHPLLQWHNPALTEVCKPFQFTTTETESLQKGLQLLIRMMMHRMRIDRGMGLAANQVGIMARILIIATKDYQQYMINPQVITVSDETCEMEEGCLSFYARKPFRITKTRPVRVTVEYQLIDGSTAIKNLEGLPARVFQHEYDHLNGIRMIDGPNPEKVKYQIDRLKKHQR